MWITIDYYDERGIPWSKVFIDQEEKAKKFIKKIEEIEKTKRRIKCYNS